MTRGMVFMNEIEMYRLTLKGERLIFGLKKEHKKIKKCDLTKKNYKKIERKKILEIK